MATTFLAGQNFTAANANNLAGIITKMKSTDNSLPNNTTTLTNDGELILPVGANTKYILVSSLQYDSSTTADISINFTTPSGSTGNWTSFGLDVTTGAGAATGLIVTIASAIGGAASAGGTNVGARQLMLPMGSIVTGANAGNVQLQFAQRISDASTTTLRAGSWVMLIASN